MKLLSQIKNSENEYDFSHLLYYGDYACANFLSRYASQCEVLPAQAYPADLKKEFGISDARLFHRKMIADGYLEPSGVDERLSASSEEEIKAVAEEVGLSTSGTKEEILQRLGLNTTPEQMSKFLPVKEVYSLSEKGKNYLSSHEDLLSLYSHWNQYHVNYNEYASIRSKNPQMPFHEVLWEVMKNRFQKYAEDTEYHRVQDEYLNMYALFKDEQKSTDALNALLTYFFMDVNVFPDTYDLIAQFKRSSLSVSEFLAHAKLPHFTADETVIADIKQLKDSYAPKTAESISRNNVSYYVGTEQYLAMLDEIYQDQLSTGDLEEMINSRIPKALDHILRSENI